MKVGVIAAINLTGYRYFIKHFITYLSPQGETDLYLPIPSWIGTNLSLFAVLVLSEGPFSDPKHFPVHYINLNHLAFANLCLIAPDVRDRRSFPRSLMAFRNPRILPRYVPLQFEHWKISRTFCVFVSSNYTE